MDPEAIRSFARRDWASVAAEKQAWWARRNAADAARAAWALWEHARRVRPDWPSEQERADDLTHHVELKRRLDLAARAFAAR